MQVTQQVFIAEEWVQNTRNEVRAKAHPRADVEKALEALKNEHTELANKLTIAERECLSATAGLKNAEAQAKDQHKLLYTTELELAIQKQLVWILRLSCKRSRMQLKRQLGWLRKLLKLQRKHPTNARCWIRTCGWWRKW